MNLVPLPLPAVKFPTRTKRVRPTFVDVGFNCWECTRTIRWRLDDILSMFARIELNEKCIFEAAEAQGWLIANKERDYTEQRAYCPHHWPWQYRQKREQAEPGRTFLEE